MFNYFTKQNGFKLNYAIKTYYKWRVIKTMYTQELGKVKEYYRNREYNYDNNNMLVKLVKTLSRSPRLDALEYFDYIVNDCKYVSKQFGLVSNINNGDVLENVLYEGNSNELFLYVDNSVDPYSMEQNWLDYESIRVIKTNSTDVGYPVLFNYERYDQEVTVFEIDVKAIMLQYYYWGRARLEEGRDISVNVFIPTVVVPNISNSLIDLGVWNRFKAIALDNKLPKEKITHPMYLIDYRSGIDKVLHQVVKENTDTSIFVTQLLTTVKGLVKDDIKEALTISKLDYNRQSLWALWVSRLQDIVDIYKIIGSRGVKINLDLYTPIPYIIKNIENREGVYTNKLDVYNLELFKENLKYLKNELGSR